MVISAKKYPYIPKQEELKELWFTDKVYTEEEEKDDLIMSYLKFSKKSNYKPNVISNTMSVFEQVEFFNFYKSL